MLRRYILEASRRRSVERLPAQIVTQVPSYLSLRKEFSVKSQQNGPQGSGSTGKPPESGSILSKFVIGSVALGAAFVAAYQTGYLDKYLIKEPLSIPESAKVGTITGYPQDSKESNSIKQDSGQSGKPITESSVYESNVSTPSVEERSNEPTPNVGHSVESIESHLDLSQLEDLSRNQDNSQSQVSGSPELSHEDVSNVQVKDTSNSQHSTMASDDAKSGSTQIEESFGLNHEVVKNTPTLEQGDEVPVKNEISSMPTQHVSSQSEPEGAPHGSTTGSSSIIDEYYLRHKDEATVVASANKVIEDLNDAYISKDGKLVLDFLQAIHEAEKRQAEIDARSFAEEKRIMKEKYEKELKDARARELMYAEREALLDKELKKERTRAVSAQKSLEEKLEERHRMELEEKETEAELSLKKTQELAKAELAAAIASEKASQIEKMAEANLHINALCMAFYARSEEARQTHSVHKLALGALALEDSLSKGLPIQNEIEALHPYLKGIDKDSLLELVLSSLPEETQKYGSDTLLQLNHKFDALKGSLRHFSLIPPGGGGILTHSLALVASWLKVRQVDKSGDGIESLINRVEILLAEDKLIEAADELEKGVKGTQAAEVVDEWIRRARNRAITDQALTLLQAYATTISLT
ncbi:PREDICTED: MICOS complex subunit MIC60 isoform X2 [Ipomoea nil]|uniref:MICOS complex subunit MIC60 isoform X2 n=1 Tax=Ipomoea nil TaxID=35883 RepID=UPI000901C229|nr:PREDICTED: MICOS complex subunit MIC60 isoform X2 [Ipomoea nil]